VAPRPDRPRVGRSTSGHGSATEDRRRPRGAAGSNRPDRWRPRPRARTRSHRPRGRTCLLRGGSAARTASPRRQTGALRPAACRAVHAGWSRGL